jgi:hypothetical protein
MVRVVACGGTRTVERTTEPEGGDGEMVSHCVGRVPKAARCAGSPRCSDCRRLVASGATRSRESVRLRGGWGDGETRRQGEK